MYFECNMIIELSHKARDETGARLAQKVFGVVTGVRRSRPNQRLSFIDGIGTPDPNPKHLVNVCSIII